ncbi:MAG: hypothetical protein HPY90_14040 [Syntrophothermus sp.]|uniref:anti-phage BREX system Lon protease BrxL n=1 Tax=Syntrophothermus sp. TaxID=2736299 RepID=UPI00257A25A1|nr:anti-phage BREX system Lon protease BrxL [Syntrophothermus sp.]NSW84358.1 hypothetical protein [Syntrophothermus sp.]
MTNHFENKTRLNTSRVDFCRRAEPRKEAKKVAYYVRPDQAEWFKAQVRERGRHQVIDKVKVRLVETEDKYWATLVNLQIDCVNIPEDLVKPSASAGPGMRSLPSR